MEKKIPTQILPSIDSLCGVPDWLSTINIADRFYLAHYRRICKKDPPFPKDMGPLAKDLIQRLLVKDPKKRLGSGPNGAENVKKHLFYQVQMVVFFKLLLKIAYISIHSP